MSHSMFYPFKKRLMVLHRELNARFVHVLIRIRRNRYVDLI